MAGLLGLLDLGAGALAAQNAGVAVSGRNTANVNTDGYSRQRVDLRSEAGVPTIGGVRALSPNRIESEILANRERLAASSGGRAGSLADALDGAGTDLASQELVSAIANLFGGLVDLTSSPMDSNLRSTAVAQAQGLAAAFRASHESIARSQSDANARIMQMTGEANQLVAEIAAANKDLALTGDPTAADRRDLAAKSLSALVGGQARIDPDGNMRFVTAGGAVLVDGQRAAKLEATNDPALGGMARIDVVDGAHRENVTSRLDGGKIGGELSFRDGDMARASASLDQLAYDFATQMNALHRDGVALDGSSGRDLFVEPTDPAGAAAAMAVDPDIAGDPRLLGGAAAGTGTGNNSVFLAMSALRNAAVAGGGTRTLSDEAIRTVAEVGSSARAAAQDRDLEAARGDFLAGLRDSLSGVSIDEEMTKLAAFQRAGQAATKFLSTVDSMLGDLISNL